MPYCRDGAFFSSLLLSYWYVVCVLKMQDFDNHLMRQDFMVSWAVVFHDTSFYFFVLLVALCVAIHRGVFWYFVVCFVFFFYFHHLEDRWWEKLAADLRGGILYDGWTDIFLGRLFEWSHGRFEQNGRNRINQILLLLWKVAIKVWFPDLICFSASWPLKGKARSTVIPEIYLSVRVEET